MDTVVFADVTIELARKACEVADFHSHILWNIAKAVAIAGEYLDGLWVVGIERVGLKGGDKLAEVVAYMFAVGDACNIELNIVQSLKALILWPHADVVALIFDAEIAKTPNLWFLVIIRFDNHTDGRRYAFGRARVVG